MRQERRAAGDAAQKRELAALEEDLRSMRRHREARSRSACGTSARRRRVPRECRRAARVHAAPARDRAARRGARGRLAEAWRALASELASDCGAFARAWRALAERLGFDEVNDLIDRHNRWYPVESRLADGSADRRLRARQRPRLPARAARRGRGCSSASRPSSSAPAPPERASGPRRREWRHDARRARRHGRAPLRSRARRASLRALGDPRVPARRAPARPERAEGARRSSSRPR